MGIRAPPTLTAMTVSRPLIHRGHDVVHAEELHDPVGEDLLGRQLGDGDVDVTAEEREEEDGENITRADAQASKGVGQHLEFHQHDQGDEKTKQQEQKRPGEGKIVHI